MSPFQNHIYIKSSRLETSWHIYSSDKTQILSTCLYSVRTNKNKFSYRVEDEIYKIITTPQQICSPKEKP